MNFTKAAEPFRFFSRMSLNVVTGRRARDAAELLAEIQSCPDSVLYAHTHHSMREHGFAADDVSNDFARWASEALQDEELAEKLMILDVFGCESIDKLRAGLAGVLSGHLAQRSDGVSRKALPGSEFQFLRSIRFSLPTRLFAKDLAEFEDALCRASFSSLYLHVIEARLRPPLGKDDFSSWLQKSAGEPRLAQEISGLDFSRRTPEEMRKDILARVSRRVMEIRRA
ncbi:MAG: DUF5752 family protein [Elusimicrobiota bacterium]